MHMQVTVCSSRNGPYSTVLDDSFNRIGRAIAGGSNDALVRSLFSHDVLRDMLINKVISIIADECLALCRRSEPSIFRKSKPVEYVDFKWLKYIEDLKCRAPVLLQLCKVIVSHGDKRNSLKHGDVHLPGICMAISVLLKERNREMVGLQTCLSMVLYTSRVPKQVSNVARMHWWSCRGVRRKMFSPRGGTQTVSLQLHNSHGSQVKHSK